MPQTMDGVPLRMSAAKRTAQFTPRRPKLGKINPAQHPDRNADQPGQSKQRRAAHDGIGHAAAGFPDRFGQLREEGRSSELAPSLSR